jgi:predicted small secreted protein
VNAVSSPMKAPGPLRAAFVVLALLLAACNGNGDDTADTTTRPPVDETTTTTEPDGEWATCENPDEGYEVGYPADWESNAGDVMSPCSVFHPEPFEVPEATELPTDLAVAISVDPPPPTTGSIGSSSSSTEPSNPPGG